MANRHHSFQAWDPRDFWIISSGRYLRKNSARLGMELADDVPVKEYAVSDFGRYLLSPDPIEFEKRLVGCEVHYHQPAPNRSRHKIWQVLPQTLSRFRKQPPEPTELLVPPGGVRIPHLKDGNLEAHLNKLYSMLKSNDPIYHGLANLDRSRISDIIGICEDLTGNRTWLRLRGSIEDKIEYIGTHIFQNVRVVLERAYMDGGVFELRAFDFSLFDSTARHRMLKVYLKGRTRVCILDSDSRVAFWLSDLVLVNYLQLLSLSIEINPSFKDAFGLFLNGAACPLKLLFKQDLAIDYSRCDLPTIYRQAISDGHIAEQDRHTILGSLNNRQLGVSVHYLPRSGSNSDRLCTNLSVIHDIRALSSIKDSLPALYQRVEEEASTTEAGNFYLLDAITGYQNVD